METLLNILDMAITMVFLLATFAGIFIVGMVDYVKKRNKIIFTILIFIMFVLATRNLHNIFINLLK